MIQIPQCFLHKAVQIERYESLLLQVEAIECIKEVEEEWTFLIKYVISTKYSFNNKNRWYITMKGD